MNVVNQFFMSFVNLVICSSISYATLLTAVISSSKEGLVKVFFMKIYKLFCSIETLEVRRAY